jgi:hypothetical protein
MDTLEKMQRLFEKIQAKANEDAEIDRDDFTPDDIAAGNIDDAYYGGSNDGEILFARELMSFFNEG